MDFLLEILELVVEFLIELIPIPKLIRRFFSFLGYLILSGICIFITINGFKIEGLSPGLMAIYWLVVIVIDTLVGYFVLKKIFRLFR